MTHMPPAVFVLGSTRSGTSAIRNAICKAGFMGPGEGHIVGLLHRLHAAVTAHYRIHALAMKQGTLLSQTPEGDLHAQVDDLFGALITSKYPGPFVDKTPNIEPLSALAEIEALWPVVTFIFCSRRGIDNILSKQRKWPGTPFENHCQEWTRLIQMWDERKGSISSKWIEMDFFELENQPRHAAQRIGGLIGSADGEIQAMANYFSGNRPEQTGASTKRYVKLSDTGWTEDEIATFLDICGDTMERKGYGLSEYWIDPAAILVGQLDTISTGPRPLA